MSARRRESQSTVDYFAAAMHPAISPLAKLTPGVISGSERIIELIRAGGGQAEHLASRDDCGARIAQLARPGDRVVIMGARDDTLSAFARELLAKLR